jgi:hypothetical protein
VEEKKYHKVKFQRLISKEDKKHFQTEADSVQLTRAVEGASKSVCDATDRDYHISKLDMFVYCIIDYTLPLLCNTLQ